MNSTDYVIDTDRKINVTIINLILLTMYNIWPIGIFGFVDIEDYVSLSDLIVTKIYMGNEWFIYRNLLVLLTKLYTKVSILITKYVGVVFYIFHHPAPHQESPVD